MKILVDADACPVKFIIEKVAKDFSLPVIMFIDTSHILESDYSEIIQVSKANDAVDFAVVNHANRGDIVVTQDYGVATMALGKGANPIHQNGRWYTDENIELMLMERHLAKEAHRKSKKNHIKGPRKRTKEDDKHFEASLRKLCIHCISSTNS